MRISDRSSDVCSSDLLHVRMGDPVFKMRDRIKRHGIQLRSSNYELYADLNRRFNAVIADHSDMVEIYSIDESFFRLPVLPDGLGNVVAAHAVREDIARSRSEEHTSELQSLMRISYA